MVRCRIGSLEMLKNTICTLAKLQIVVMALGLVALVDDFFATAIAAADHHVLVFDFVIGDDF